MADLTVEPTSAEGPIRQTVARVLRADFGDGYSQRAADGINSLDEAYQVEWENLDATEEAALIAQLEAALGITTIDWIPYDETVAMKFTVQSWEKTLIIGSAGRAYKLSAVFRKENDL